MEGSMSQENTQNATGSIERPPVEKAIAQEVGPENQNGESQPSAEVGGLVAESKKYRKRAQVAEDKLLKMEKKIATAKEEQLAEQNKWQELAEQRGVKLLEQEPVIEAAKAEIDSIREELLADFDEEERDSFGSLDLTQLRTLHKKIFQNDNKVAPTDATPARSINPENKDWQTMSKEDRRKNWQSIVDSYRIKKK